MIVEGIINGKVVCTQKKMPSRRSTKLRLYADTGNVNLVADGSDFIVVVAEVTDDNGNVRRLAKENIVFTVEEGIYVGYRYFDTFGKEVSYPFGHGLSYTAFDYAVENAKMDADRCELKVSVKNIGKVAGREAVQLYVKAPNGGLDKPAKELKAFGKTALLQPGESQTLILTWNVMDMASFNEKNSSWELAKGEYQWMVAASSADVRCTAVQRVTKARKQKVHDAMRAQVPVAVYPMVKR